MMGKFFILILLVTLSPFSQADKILPAPEKIAPHSYAWIGPLPGPSFENQGYRMNLGFIVGTKGIVVIDTGYTEAMAIEMLAHIRKISNAPIVVAVNTNSQAHRFFGNTVFKKAGAKIISTAKEKQRMAANLSQHKSAIERILKLDKNSIKSPVLPDAILSKPVTIQLGGVNVILKSLGASHTPASVVAHVVEDKLVYAGDILYGERMLSVLPDSHVKQWIATFNNLKQFGNAIFVPGHGHAGPLKDFEFSTLSYLQRLHAHMTKSLEDDLEAQDAINSLDQTAYSKLVLFKNLAGRNASWAFLEAEKAAFE